jgi:hypothetical protein
VGEHPQQSGHHSTIRIVLTGGKSGRSVARSATALTGADPLSRWLFQRIKADSATVGRSRSMPIPSMPFGP